MMCCTWQVLFDLVVEDETVRVLALDALSEFLDRAKHSIAHKGGRFDYEKLLLVITQQCRSPYTTHTRCAI